MRLGRNTCLARRGIHQVPHGLKGYLHEIPSFPDCLHIGSVLPRHLLHES